jgi:CBS domain-containing protein
MKISDCMTRNVQLADPTMSLREAARIMGECDAGVLPVGENDRLVGMLTDRDIAIRGVACGLGPEAKVRDAMTSQVEWCYADTDAGEALQHMAQAQIRRMPVLDRSKRLVGIVSLSDLSDTRPEQSGEALCAITREGGQHTQTLH